MASPKFPAYVIITFFLKFLNIFEILFLMVDVIQRFFFLFDIFFEYVF